MANRLAAEKSPFLFQHKSNLVNWYPWCDKVFQKRRIRIADLLTHRLLHLLLMPCDGLWILWGQEDMSSRGFRICCSTSRGSGHPIGKLFVANKQITAAVQTVQPSAIEMPNRGLLQEEYHLLHPGCQVIYRDAIFSLYFIKPISSILRRWSSVRLWTPQHNKNRGRVQAT